MNPVDFLVDFLSRFENGNVFLEAGTHVHKIPTKGMPGQIWLSEVTTGDVPVCQGGVNKFGVTLDYDGFILYADVVSDTVNVAWQAYLEKL